MIQIITNHHRAHRVVLEVEELDDVLGLGEARQDLDLVEEGEPDPICPDE